MTKYLFVVSKGQKGVRPKFWESRDSRSNDFLEKTTTMKTIPFEVKETGFYEPNEMGFEKKVRDRIEYWKRLKENLSKKLIISSQKFDFF
jgi:hypothetical protein